MSAINGVVTIRRTFGNGHVVVFHGLILKRGPGAVLLRERPGRETWLHVGTHVAPDPRWSMTTVIEDES